MNESCHTYDMRHVTHMKENARERVSERACVRGSICMCERENVCVRERERERVGEWVTESH